MRSRPLSSWITTGTLCGMQSFHAEDCPADAVMARATNDWPEYDPSSLEGRTLAVTAHLKHLTLEAAEVDIKEAEEYLANMGMGVGIHVKGMLDAIEEGQEDMEKTISGQCDLCAVQWQPLELGVVVVVSDINT
ncbi:unnamed protein product [Polarella glacialis]|uniref:Uncharacterized protein n=1 Tax=Polarella glacialis TaxID=89957 RepID=A0A813I482_POLGL|nr:unnamed protein product [Polarella glacialis]